MEKNSLGTRATTEARTACLLFCPTFKHQSTLDVPYVPSAGHRQRLDVFRPEGQTGRPVVLMVHGGAWMIGDKNFHGLYRDVAEGLAKQGLVVVTANYRLAPWVQHP